MTGQRIVTIDQYRETLNKGPSIDEVTNEKIRAEAEQEHGSTHVLFWVEFEGDEPLYRRDYFSSYEAALTQAHENQGIKTQ